MNIYSIYRITNLLNGKVYIGFSSDVDNRIRTHFAIRRNSPRSKLQHAIAKYGADSFVADIIYQAKEEVPYELSHTLTAMEPFFIEEYDSIRNGYNVAQGGRCGPALKGELNGMFGKTHTDEVKRICGETAIATFAGKSYADLYGDEKANELKKLRSESMQAYRKQNPPVGNKNANAKTILLVSPDRTGHVIRGGLRSFCFVNNLQIGAVIDMLKGRRHHYKEWAGVYLQ